MEGKNLNENNNGIIMEISDGWKKARPPERETEIELEWEDYHRRVRASDAILKAKAHRNHLDHSRRMSLPRQRLVEQQLFLSLDIDINRIKFSDAGLPAAHPINIKKPKFKKQVNKMPTVPRGIKVFDAGFSAPTPTLQVSKFPNKD